MSIDNIELYNCAGLQEGDGCGIFERFFSNEVAYLESNPDDPIYSLVDNHEELRAKLLQVFIEDEHCPVRTKIAKEKQADRLPPNVIPFRRKTIATYIGCQFVDITDTSSKAQ